MPTRSCPAVSALAVGFAVLAPPPDIARAEIADVDAYRVVFTNPRIIPHPGGNGVFEDVFDKSSPAFGDFDAAGSASASHGVLSSSGHVTLNSSIASGTFLARGSADAFASASFDTAIIENQSISFAQYTFDVLADAPFAIHAEVRASHTLPQPDVLARVALIDDASGLFIFNIEARTDRPFDSIDADAILSPGRYRLLAFASDQLFVDGAHPDAQTFSASYSVTATVPAPGAPLLIAMPFLALSARRRRPSP